MKEDFANTTLDPSITAAINQIYQADIEAIRNLSSFAATLMSGNQVVIPANVIIQGNLTISGNLSTTGTTTSVGITTANDININKDQWIRVHGQGGIFWQDYGGGWNMVDTTYIRAYNNVTIYTPKNIYAAGSITADGSVITGSWFRTEGDGGIVFDKHGGGWYMTDNTWLRTVGDKGIYSPTQIRTDGTVELGQTGNNPARIIFNNGGNIKAGSGGGVATCDGNGACGRLNNGGWNSNAV